MKEKISQSSVFAQIQSDAFVLEQSDEQIDEWNLGADLAGWLCSRILPIQDLFYHQGPTMEDWGWQLGFVAKNRIVWVKLWAPRESRNLWTIELFLEQKKGLFTKGKGQDTDLLDYLKGKLDDIFRNAEEFEAFEWLKENPLL